MLLFCSVSELDDYFIRIATTEITFVADSSEFRDYFHERMSSFTPVDWSACLTSSSNMSSFSSQVIGDDNGDAFNIQLPRLVIVEEPQEKFRFRYRSEMMGTHGCILGRRSDRLRKRYPEVKLINYNGGPAIIRCSLVAFLSNSNNPVPHAHRLTVRVQDVDQEEPQEIVVDEQTSYTAVFQGMGIVHTAKRYVVEELVKKKRRELLEKVKGTRSNDNSLSVREEMRIKEEAQSEAKMMNLNIVNLCFEAFCKDAYGVLRPICDKVYSTPISNMKSAQTGELKICRIDKIDSSCLGGETIFILVEKVAKKNIMVRFFELDNDEYGQECEVWEDFGKFTELDVHHQYAVVFKTPRYRNINIEQPKDVFLQLYRPSDKDSSDPIKFTYKPRETVGRKRLRHQISYDTIPTAVVQGFSHQNETALESYSKTLQEEIIRSDEFPEKGKKCQLRNQRKPSFSENVTKQICEFGSNVDSMSCFLERKTADGNMTLHLVVQHCKISLLERLLFVIEKKNLLDYLNKTNLSQQTCLHLAVMQKEWDKVGLLLKYGGKPEMKDCRGNTAYHLAVSGHVNNGIKRYVQNRCMEELLNQKNFERSKFQVSNLNIFNEAGLTPLHLAIDNEDLTAIEALVKANCDVNCFDIHGGCSALYMAILAGNIQIVRILLSHVRLEVMLGFQPSSYEVNPPVNEKVQASSAVTQLTSNMFPSLNSNVPNTPDELLGIRIEELLATQPENISREFSLGIYISESLQIFSLNLEEDQKEFFEDFSGPHPTIDVDYCCRRKMNPLKLTSVIHGKNSEIMSLLREKLNISDERARQLEEVDSSDDEQEIPSNEDQIEKSCAVQQLVDPGYEPITTPETHVESDSSLIVEEEVFTIISDILDKSGKWKDLAKLLEYDFLVLAIQEHSSPTRSLLCYADVHDDVSMGKMKEILKQIGEERAAERIGKMMIQK
ncbi:hypothetical protein J437_LFUL006013 [Ladona fulva]|uniref:RHD domain-containing protein n=1 Tax=Ladona fulva TaxID=123851 RepID=A0A8K0JYK0_LADFU|nr:hypothetical protein J437_LFUL006013 [Ladona fulva]